MKEGIERQKTSLAEFREEIRNWVAEELKKKSEWEARGRTGPAYDPHADYIDAGTLTEADMELWEKYNDRNITRGDFDEHRKQIAGVSLTDSRMNFQAMLANKANHLMLKKELEARKINKRNNPGS